MQRIQDQSSEIPQKSPLLAAIDLGSNSFHLIIARVEHGEIRAIERVGEKIQLASGLEERRLNEASIERGLECLRRFKQIIDSFEPDIIRIVGTNTLRAAKNARQFNSRAREILGQAIDIIGGREEARLIYLGVSHTLADDGNTRLVIDIGGGSTEFIIGQRFETHQLESLHMGCVSYTNRFFDDGKISEKRFNSAYQAATMELLNIRAQYVSSNWQECIGSSGTFKAIDAILLENGWSEHAITRAGLLALKQRLLTFKQHDAIAVDGLKEARQGVIVAGVAIALAAFDVLQIETMRFSNGALREGVIYDTIGRLGHEDVRERTVNALMSRYNVNAEKAERVEQRCLHLFEQLERQWGLDHTDHQYLSWAAKLHEIGLAIAHTQFHRHGHYLLLNSDLPGFANNDQTVIALLVRSHRRKIPISLIDESSPMDSTRLLRLIVILRLAVLFKYVETLENLPPIKAKSNGFSLHLNLEDDWLSNHPLTEAELLEEQHYLANVDFSLQLKNI